MVQARECWVCGGGRQGRPLCCEGLALDFERDSGYDLKNPWEKAPRNLFLFSFTISPDQVLGRRSTTFKRPGVGKTLPNLEETNCFKVWYYSLLFPQPQALFVCLTTSKEVYFIT